MDRGYIYVNKKNYLDNIDYLNSLSDKELCLVVKANGYGHGVEWTVNTAIEAGVKWFAVATINEAIAVRKLSDSIRILLLTEPSLSEVEKVATNNIDLTVYNDFFIDGLDKSGLSINKSDNILFCVIAILVLPIVELTIMLLSLFIKQSLTLYYIRINICMRFEEFLG